MRVTDTGEPDAVFEGSIPEVYDRLLVPLVFEPYAVDLAERIASAEPSSVLEVAAGSGVATRAMCERLAPDVSVTATDLNQPMIDRARSVGTARPVRWEQADACELPFDDDSFDIVVCQFGVMFFPDKAAAFGEIARVLAPDGQFLFNTWDRIESNEFAEVVTRAVGALWPDDPPRFLARIPHGYFDERAMRADLAPWFGDQVQIDALEARSLAASCDVPAVAYCHGTPLRNEIEQRGIDRLDEATRAAAAALGDRFGSTDLDGKIRAFVACAEKPR